MKFLRCTWPKNELSMNYHDKEWGVPLHDDQKLFEFLILDAFQAGLNWQIILDKRNAFKTAFADFDPKKVARFNKKNIGALLKNKNIIRNKQKIEAAIINAQKFIEVQKEFGSFDNYIWQFTQNKQIKNSWTHDEQIPATSQESDAMSLELKKRGFKFVGSTICYAFMQATGMVNDHLTSCFRYKEVQKL